MDELAEEAGIDPVTFRLNHLEDQRAKEVLQAAADKLGWGLRCQKDEDGALHLRNTKTFKPMPRSR